MSDCESNIENNRLLIDDPSVFLSESERKMDEELGKIFYENFLKWEAQQKEDDNISL